MRPTSNTSMLRSEDRETVIVEFPRQMSSAAVTRRSRTVVHISDEQVAEFTELLNEFVRLVEQITEMWAQTAASWAQVAETWSQIAEPLERQANRSDKLLTYCTAMTGKRNGDSIVPEKCAETRCLSQTPCAQTQVIEKQPKKEMAF